MCSRVGGSWPLSISLAAGDVIAEMARARSSELCWSRMRRHSSVSWVSLILPIALMIMRRRLSYTGKVAIVVWWASSVEISLAEEKDECLADHAVGKGQDGCLPDHAAGEDSHRPAREATSQNVAIVPAIQQAQQCSAHYAQLVHQPAPYNPHAIVMAVTPEQ
jgi:hypothetical protein